MLSRFFKKEVPKLYLGTIAVAPRSDLKRHLDEWGVWGREDLDTSMLESLQELFELPLASEVKDPKEIDLVLDVIIPKFQSGDMWDVSLGEIGFPIAWRPKIEIGARLYRLQTKKTVYTATVLVKMSWREYFARLFTLRALFRFRPMFDSSDMRRLLYIACNKLIIKLHKAV